MKKQKPKYQNLKKMNEERKVNESTEPTQSSEPQNAEPQSEETSEAAQSKETSEAAQNETNKAKAATIKVRDHRGKNVEMPSPFAPKVIEPQRGIMEISEIVKLRLTAIDMDTQRNIDLIVAVGQEKINGEIKAQKAAAAARKDEILRNEIVKGGGKYESSFTVEQDYSVVHIQ